MCAPLPGLGADSRRATKAAAWRAIPPSTSTLWDTDVVAVGAHESPPLHRSIVLSPSSGLIADKESPAMRWRGCRRRPPRRRRGARPWCRTRNVPCSRVFAALLERHHKPPAHAKLEPSPPPGEWCICIRPLGPALVIAPSHDGVRRPRGSVTPTAAWEAQVTNSPRAIGAALDGWNSGMSLRKRRYYPALYSTAEQRISPLLVTVHIRSLHNHSNQVSDRLIPGSPALRALRSA